MTDDVLKDIITYVPEGEANNLPAIVEDAVFEPMEALDSDFHLARDNLREMASLSQEAMREFAKMAKQMQDPRAYGTLSKLLTAAILAQKAVVEIHKNKVDGRDRTGTNDDTTGETKNVTNNIIMTTDQMLLLLERSRNARNN